MMSDCSRDRLKSGECGTEDQTGELRTAIGEILAQSEL